MDPQKRDKCWLTSSSLLKQILNSWPSWNFLVLGKPGGGPPHLASHVRKQRLLRLRQVHVSHLLPLVCRRHSLWTESFWVSSTRQSCKTMRTTTSKYCRSKHGSLSFQLQCSMFILHFDQRLVMSLIVHKLLVRHVCCIDSRADRASSGQQCRFPWLALAANSPE